MICPQCGEYVAPKAKHCSECGTPVFHINEETVTRAKQVKPFGDNEVSQAKKQHTKSGILNYVFAGIIATLLLGCLVMLVLIFAGIGFTWLNQPFDNQSKKANGEQPTSQPTTQTQPTTQPTQEQNKNPVPQPTQQPTQQEPIQANQTNIGRMFEIVHLGAGDFPAIETERRLIPNSFAVAPGQFTVFDFEITQPSRVYCLFQAQGGSGNDIQVLISNSQDMINLKNGNRARVIYDSGKITTDSIYVNLPQGLYSIGFNNRFSVVSNKSIFVEMFIPSVLP